MSGRGERCAPFEHDRDTELGRIEAEISRHRVQYLQAVWAGHDGESEYHEAEVDRLIGLWDDTRRAAVAEGAT